MSPPPFFVSFYLFLYALLFQVGSKYHEFIESADAIAAMQTKSEEIGNKLGIFWGHSKDIVKKAKMLTVHKDGKNFSSSNNGSNINSMLQTAKKYKPIDITSVWEYLEVCDVFSASRVLLVAGLVLKEISSNCPFLPSMQVVACLPPDFRQRVHSVLFSADSDKSLVTGFLAGCSAALSLQQTVLDDSRLLLLDKRCPPAETLRTLAAYGLLTGKNRAELLTMYLDGVDLVVDASLAGMCDTFVDTSVVASKILAIVSTFQRAILDIHTLFMRPHGESRDAAGCLLAQHQALLEDCEWQLNLVLGSLRRTVEMEPLRFDLRDGQAGYSSQETRLQFDKWFRAAISRVLKSSDGALGSMRSATDVARLQQRIWQCSTTIECVAVGGSPDPCSTNFIYTQTDWEAACAELLTPRGRARPQKPAGGLPAESYSTLLWSSAFRAPFVRQVERLLRESCRGILLDCKKQIVAMLAAEGLTVAVDSLNVSPAPEFASSSGSISSSRVYARAERVRAVLEVDVVDLVSNIILPVQEGDPQCAASLSRALLVQCSQLAGQIAVTLRVLAENCNTALGKSSDDNSAAMAGLLLIGRLAWLLKIRGKFFEEALVSLPLSQELTRFQDRSAEYTSDDQLRSAFEIADTDGDGVVTCSEALEAAQALAVGDASRAAALHLSSAVTPSLTFLEFSLLCADMLSPEICPPAKRLNDCLEEISVKSHSKFADRLIAHLSSDFAIRIKDGYGIGFLTERANALKADPRRQLSARQNLSVPAAFKYMWRHESIQMDADESDLSSSEQLALPVAASEPLAAFLFAVNQGSTTALLSVDSLQQLSPVEALNAYHTKRAEKGHYKLARESLDAIHSAMFASITDIYSSLLKDATTLNNSLLSGGSTWLEDCALQACFDLAVVESIATRCSVILPKAHKLCVAGWRSKLDPINAELTGPYVSANTKAYNTRTFLLFPCIVGNIGEAIACTTGTGVAPTTYSGSGVSGNVGGGSKFGLLPLLIGVSGGGSWDKKQGVVVDASKIKDEEVVASGGATKQKKGGDSWGFGNLIKMH